MRFDCRRTPKNSSWASSTWVSRAYINHRQVGTRTPSDGWHNADVVVVVMRANENDYHSWLANYGRGWKWRKSEVKNERARKWAPSLIRRVGFTYSRADTNEARRELTVCQRDSPLTDVEGLGPAAAGLEWDFCLLHGPQHRCVQSDGIFRAPSRQLCGKCCLKARLCFPLWQPECLYSARCFAFCATHPAPSALVSLSSWRLAGNRNLLRPGRANFLVCQPESHPGFSLPGTWYSLRGYWIHGY